MNPHDTFFRRMLSNRELAIDFLRNYLPEDLRAHMDLETLQQEDGSFVDETLSDSYSDLLYTVKVSEKETFLYLLFEHKSFPDKFTALQILKYMSSIWERFHTNHAGALLPPVLPLVLYHGETVWRYGSRFSTLLDAPGTLAPYLLDFSFTIWDLSSIPDSEIRGAIAIQLFLMFLKHIREDDFETRLPALIELMNALLQGQHRGAVYLRLFAAYMATATDKLDKKRIRRYFARYQDLRETVMPTLAQQYRAEGKAEGKLEEKLETARAMLKEGDSVEKIVRVTGLSLEETIHLQASLEDGVKE